MGVTNEFERDVNDTSFLHRPGRVDLIVFQNTADCGDGHPGVQRCFRNYLHEGGMEKDLDVNSFDVKNVIDIELSGEIIFPSATIHSSGAEIHLHPNTGNADGNLIIHPIGSNTGTHLHLRNDVTANHGIFSMQIDGAVASLQSSLGGGGTAPSTININDADWDNINIGDASATISMNGVSMITAEWTQISNINSVTISNTQWGYIGGADQPVKQADSPTFASPIITNLNLADDIIHVGDTNNLISFGTDTQDFQTGGGSRMDISDSGVRFGGSGVRITGIVDDDNLGTSDVVLCTQGNVKVYSDANSIHAVASDDLVFSNDTERNSVGPDDSYEKLKEITIYKKANIRVSWQMKASESGTVYSKVYINDIAVGSEKSTSSTIYTGTYTEDVTVNVGDLLQIYGHGGDGVPPSCYVQYQRIKFIEFVSTGGY